MRLRPLLATIFAGLALVQTSTGVVVLERFTTERTRVRVEAQMADLSGHLRSLIDTNIAERLGDMRVLTEVARTTATTADARRAWLKALRDTYAAYAWIGFADRSGLVTASTDGVLEGVSVAARPWFQHGLDAAFVGDLHEAALLAKMSPPLPGGEPLRFVDVAAPLRDREGGVVGVVGAHLSLAWMQAMSRAALAPALARDPSIEVMVVGSDGTVVIGPPAHLGERLLPGLSVLDKLTGTRAQVSQIETWPDGTGYVVGASRSPDMDGHPTLPWTVIVRQPVEVALATARWFGLVILAGGLAFACLFAMIGWWVAGRVAAPLLDLARSSCAVDDARALADLPVPRGFTEVSELTGALSALLHRVAERDRSLARANAELEQRVSTRTRELARSHAFVRSILDATPNGIMVLFPDGSLEFANAAGARLCDDASPPRLALLSLPDLWPDAEQQTVRAAVATAADGTSTHLTAHRVTAEGGVCWWQLAVTPIPAVDGRPERVLVIATDVTALKQSETELTRARDAAEAARVQAEAADLAKGEFLATMSHEIRTPLNAIKGFNELLGDDSSLSPGQRRYVERVGSACGLLIAVVDDILDYTRIEAGGVALECEAFAPRVLVADTVAMIKGFAAAKDLALTTVIVPDLPDWLAGDVTRLRQVLLNLVNNAIKFTAHGSVAITVGYGDEPGGRRFRIAVRDTGIGIAAEAQTRLFARFSQADSSTSRRFGGSGLGLAIAKGLVEAMDGEIGLVSAEGAGATFWFSVPLARTEAPHAPPRPFMERPILSCPSSTAGSRGRLLLVEDVESNQVIGRAVLERGGYSVDVASNGLEAFGAVMAHAYDLVLMDVQMPEMDGLTATRAIRALAHPSRDVPIVAMTANVLPEQVDRFKAAGMNDHVGKPFERRALFAVIERWLEPDEAVSVGAG